MTIYRYNRTIISPRKKKAAAGKYYLLIILLSLFMNDIYSQSITWQRAYRQYIINEGIASCQTNDGDFVIVGQAIGNRLFAMKINPAGDTLWSVILNSMPNSIAYAVTSAGDGGVVLTGQWDSSFTIKLSAGGNLEWKKMYDGGTIECHDIKKTPDGGYIFCGGYVYNFERSYIAKINSFGNLIWSRTYSSGFIKIFNSVEFALDGGYIFTGTVQESELTPGRVLVFKINDTGDSLWEKRFSINNTSPGGLKIRKLNQSYLIGGITNDSANFLQLFYSRINLIGDTTFVKTFPSGGRNEIFEDILVLNDNKYVLCFQRDSSTMNYSSFGMITDSAGNVLQRKNFTSTSYFFQSSLRSIVRVSNGDLLFTGWAKVNPPFNDIVVYAVRSDSLLNAPELIGINNITGVVPEGFILHQNYPNPFNPVTTIRYEVKNRADIRMEIYNVLGELREVILDRDHNPGIFEISWDASNLASGTYFIRMTVNNKNISTVKSLLIK